MTTKPWPCRRCASYKAPCVPPTLKDSMTQTPSLHHFSINIVFINKFSSSSNHEVNSRKPHTPHAPHAPYTGSLGSSSPSYTPLHMDSRSSDRSQSSSLSPDVDSVDRATSAASDPAAPSQKRPRDNAENCFTCADLHIECDRKRPYCTQCMVKGKGCQDYRTPLRCSQGIASSVRYERLIPL